MGDTRLYKQKDSYEEALIDILEGFMVSITEAMNDFLMKEITQKVFKCHGYFSIMWLW